MHKKGNGIKHPCDLTVSARCLGTARAIDRRQFSEVEAGNEKLGSCPRVLLHVPWGNALCRRLLRSHAANVHGASCANCYRQVPLLTRGKVYSSCVRSVMIHAAETWAMKANTLNCLRRYDRAILWICNVKAKDEVGSESLLTKLGIQDLGRVLRTSRMR